jgi:transglutaminase-like putative cysteine protease
VTVEPYVRSEDVARDGIGDLSDGNPAWTQLPDGLPDRVRALARDITAGAGDRIASARALSGWLRANVRYTTSSPVPRPGEDAVDRVLFEDRLGFCEQFAASEVVLLRTLGIPARLVTGLAYGVPSGSTRTYTAKDLHAWVELWVPGQGWVTDDPTAGAELASDGAGNRLRNAVLRWTRSVPTAVGGRLPLALLVAAAAVGVAVLARRPARPVGAPAPARGASALAAYQRWNARLGAARRRDSETLRELGGRIGGPVVRALEVVEQELYAPVTPDPQRAVEVLDRS